MESILLIRFSSLGDVILTTALVRQLQLTYPRAVIDVAVASRFAGVYEFNPRVRNVWAVDPSPTADNLEADAVRLSMHESLPNRAYDLIVDAQNNIRSAAFVRGLGTTVRRAPKYRLQKLAMVWLKQRPAVTTHVVERYRQPLLDLPLAFDTDGLEVWTPAEKHGGVYSPRSLGGHRRSVTSLRGATIAVAPGAHHATKRWPADKFVAAIAMLQEQGADVVLVGSEFDRPTCDAIAHRVLRPVHRADGAQSLQETITALDAADALLVNDSGVLHLGAARRIPTVAVFGSTVPELGFGPYGVPHRIIQHDVGCRPCSHIGRSRCPKGHFLCMEGIAPIAAVDALESLLTGSVGGTHFAS